MHWEDRESMTERDVETIVRRGLERYPGVKPRIISGNGPQSIARDVKEFIRVAETTHERTSPYHPQSPCTLKRWHGGLTRERERPAPPSSPEEVRRRNTSHVDRRNTVRLHIVLGHVKPMDKRAGLDEVIFAERDSMLEEAREVRRQTRQTARAVA